MDLALRGYVRVFWGCFAEHLVNYGVLNSKIAPWNSFSDKIMITSQTISEKKRRFPRTILS